MPVFCIDLDWPRGHFATTNIEAMSLPDRICNRRHIGDVKPRGMGTAAGKRASTGIRCAPTKPPPETKMEPGCIGRFYFG